MIHSRSERGQVLMLVLISLVGLMGFAALVVDGGQLYNERRRAQSAADAAALAAASAGSKEKTDPEIATIVSGMANQNGFFNGANNTTVTYNHPPASGNYAGNDEYYQIFITEQVAPIFSQFVFSGTQQVTVEAVARARPYTPLSGDNAMMAIANCGCGAVFDILGNASMTIRGGNIFSNDDGEKKGNAGDIYVYASADPKVTTVGEVVTVGAWSNTRQIHANFVSGAGEVSLDSVPTPYCPASDEYDAVNNVHYYVWTGDQFSKDQIAMPLKPGVHCVTGDIDLSGKHKDLIGDGVLLVLQTGGLKSKGGGNINLTRASNLVDMNGNQWGGMAIYSPKTNKSDWDLGGNSTTIFNGTVLALHATCDIGGTPTNSVNRAAFICWDFKIHGNPDIKVTYDPKENWQLPPSLSLMH